jgi:hypothetical protein
MRTLPNRPRLSAGATMLSLPPGPTSLNSRAALYPYGVRPRTLKVRSSRSGFEGFYLGPHAVVVDNSGDNTFLSRLEM